MCPHTTLQLGKKATVASCSRQLASQANNFKISSKAVLQLAYEALQSEVCTSFAEIAIPVSRTIQDPRIWKNTLQVQLP